MCYLFQIIEHLLFFGMDLHQVFKKKEVMKKLKEIQQTPKSKTWGHKPAWANVSVPNETKSLCGADYFAVLT